MTIFICNKDTGKISQKDEGNTALETMTRNSQ